MRVTFSWKCSKFNVDWKNAQNNSEKKKFVFEVNVSELSLLRREYLLSAVNVLTKSLKILHLPKSVFSNSITFRVIEEYDKGTVRDIDWVFGPVYHVACRGYSRTRLFRHLANYIFGTPSFRKYISYEGHLFWKCSKFDVDLKKAQKNLETFFVF